MIYGIEILARFCESPAQDFSASLCLERIEEDESLSVIFFLLSTYDYES